MKSIKLLCTLGPSSFDGATITKLDAVGVDLFRINLSHTELDELENLILSIRRFTQKPICLDTEGAQVRTGSVEGDKIYLEDDNTIHLVKDRTTIGNKESLSLNPSFVIDRLQPGDLISLDFDSVLVLTVTCRENEVMAKVVSGGWVGSNKAVTIDRHIKLPALSDKDLKAIQIGQRYGLRHFALSFASTREDVEYFRNQVGKEAYMICKIENSEGVANVDQILELSDAILIDRGDLSREEPIEKIPFIQKWLIQSAKKRQKPIYVATNLLESMVTNKKPTRAEVNDVINTLLDGADGLVLAAETAIGRSPVQCASMVMKLIKEFQNHPDPFEKKTFFAGTDFSQSVDPGSKKLPVPSAILRNAYHLSIGLFSPLTGFMNKEDVISVLDHSRLSDGVIWPVSIVLPIDLKTGMGFETGDRVALVPEGDEEIYAYIHIEDIFMYNLEDLSKVIPLHDFRHKYFVAGKVEWQKKRFFELDPLELAPGQTKNIFENRGWNRILGVDATTMNLIDPATLEDTFNKYHCDGLFIQNPSPETGNRFSTDAPYLKGKVLESVSQPGIKPLSLRGLIFTLLCARNYGCTHFLVASERLREGSNFAQTVKQFDSWNELGIVPIFSHESMLVKS